MIANAVALARAGVRFARAPHQALVDLHRRFGPVVLLGIGSNRTAFLLGPEANRFVLGHSELFRWREASTRWSWWTARPR